MSLPESSSSSSLSSLLSDLRTTVSRLEDHLTKLPSPEYTYTAYTMSEDGILFKSGDRSSLQDARRCLSQVLFNSFPKTTLHFLNNLTSPVLVDVVIDLSTKDVLGVIIRRRA